MHPANGNVDKVKLALSYGDYRYIKKFLLLILIFKKNGNGARSS